MCKLLWVLLPLLLAGAVLAGLALRRRTPSRLALNVWSSLLLLAYVLGTAGLGLFWVPTSNCRCSTGITCSVTRRCCC